eukprot:1522363-Amphidinium_carterae.1
MAPQSIRDSTHVQTFKLNSLHISDGQNIVASRARSCGTQCFTSTLNKVLGPMHTFLSMEQ